MAAEARGRVRVEPSRKRVRALLGGHLVVDTLRPYLVWESPYYPSYYVPATDVVAKLEPIDRVEHSPSRGEARYYDVLVDGQVARGAAWAYPESPLEALRDLVRIEWSAMDTWLEEDEPVYTHPRDPYSRVDILASSRRVQVAVDGVELADSDQPRILFETGLPPRYYLPLTHTRVELLRPSQKVTHCPYKGAASYWSVDVNGRLYEDLVWSYPAPFAECQKIAGLVAFYDERVDVRIDGVEMERPRSPFS